MGSLLKVDSCCGDQGKGSPHGEQDEVGDLGRYVKVWQIWGGELFESVLKWKSDLDQIPDQGNRI